MIPPDVIPQHNSWNIPFKTWHRTVLNHIFEDLYLIHIYKYILQSFYSHTNTKTSNRYIFHSIQWPHNSDMISEGSDWRHSTLCFPHGQVNAFVWENNIFFSWNPLLFGYGNVTIVVTVVTYWNVPKITFSKIKILYCVPKGVKLKKITKTFFCIILSQLYEKVMAMIIFTDGQLYVYLDKNTP